MAKKSNTLLYLGLAAAALFIVPKLMKSKSNNASTLTDDQLRAAIAKAYGLDLSALQAFSRQELLMRFPEYA